MSTRSALRAAIVAALCVAAAPAKKRELKLKSNFGSGGEIPPDHRGDEDNISPPISWSGAPKNTQSYVLIVESDSSKGGGRRMSGGSGGASDDGDGDGGGARVTNWIIYDIPKEVKELREELSGAGSSDVARLGMKDDAGTAPIVVDPMGNIDGWVDPEVEQMQNMIHGALDASFEDRNRAKEGSNSFGTTYYSGPTQPGATTTFKLYALAGRLELPRAASKEDVVRAMKGKVLAKATLAGVVGD